VSFFGKLSGFDQLGKLSIDQLGCLLPGCLLHPGITIIGVTLPSIARATNAIVDSFRDNGQNHLQKLATADRRDVRHQRQKPFCCTVTSLQAALGGRQSPPTTRKMGALSIEIHDVSADR
jgi:hypothetical protein